LTSDSGSATVADMEDSIGVRQLREELHFNLAWIAHGNRLVVRRRGQRLALLRAALPEDGGRETPLTEFRHTMCATLRRARRRPQLLTLYGDPVAVLERYAPAQVPS
jgi:hypothetical protein